MNKLLLVCYLVKVIFFLPNLKQCNVYWFYSKYKLNEIYRTCRKKKTKEKCKKKN